MIQLYCKYHNILIISFFSIHQINNCPIGYFKTKWQDFMCIHLNNQYIHSKIITVIIYCERVIYFFFHFFLSIENNFDPFNLNWCNILYILLFFYQFNKYFPIISVFNLFSLRIFTLGFISNIILFFLYLFVLIDLQYFDIPIYIYNFDSHN